MTTPVETFMAREALLCAEPGPSYYALQKGLLYSVAGVGSALLGVGLVVHLSGVALLSFPLAFTVAAVAVGAFYAAERIIDYGDPAIRREVRLEPYGLFLAVRELHQRGIDVSDWIPRLLDEIVEKHGFGTMKRYGIPHPDHLAEIFEFQKEKCPFSVTFPICVRFHRGLERGDFSYALEPPKKGFAGEVAKLDMAQLLKEYEPEELREYGVVTDEQAKRLIALRDELTQEYDALRTNMVGWGIADVEAKIEDARKKRESLEREEKRKCFSQLCHREREAGIRALGHALAAAYAVKERREAEADEIDAVRRGSALIQGRNDEVDLCDRTPIAEKYAAEVARLVHDRQAPIVQASVERTKALEALEAGLARVEGAYSKRVAEAKRHRDETYLAWLAEYTALVNRRTQEFRREFFRAAGEGAAARLQAE